ncbi:protein kinase domain-containing protein [Pelobacter seleniigenes]|uniref:protein kinase domain-containing protein n=1 Tax=Pelobacter seleniigenes TaxID=407188 RepID=UPI0004A6B24B|nr:protein kinase [Pelobacter seleniigenes]
MDEHINDILVYFGFNFKIINKLKTSGQRTAYLGDQKGTKVVIKITPAIESNVARIQREFKILSSLNSPLFPKIHKISFITRENLENYHDHLIGEDAAKAAEFIKLNPTPFIYTVEEYIENISWKVVLPKLREEPIFIDFLNNLVIGLALLWEKKIIHRDLKPDNILIRKDLTPTIIDLGIAKSLNPGTRDITSPFFHTPCTPRFAAPEQLLNKKTEISYKSDQFSIGVIGYLILTGRYPYGDVEVDGLDFVIRKMNSKGTIDFSASCINNGQIFTLISKLLEIQPYKRFRIAEDIIKQLKTAKGAI